MDRDLIAQWLLDTTWQSAVLVVVIFLVQFLLSRWLSPAWRCALWGIVLIRLMMPALPSSGMSLYGIWCATAQKSTVAMPVVPVAPQSRINVKILPAGASTMREAAPSVLPMARPPEPSRWPWQAIAMCIYVLIAAVLLLRRTAQMLASRRLRKSAMPRAIACSIPVLESEHVHTPALAGLFRPCILLPCGMAAQLSRPQLDLVLDHELAHLRRRDHWAHAAWSVLQAVHWFNPFVYFAFSRYRLECELACDQAVLVRQSEPASQALYGQMLLNLATGTSPVPAAVGMAEGRRHLKARIRQIAADPPRRSPAVAGTLTLLLVAICGLTQAQTPAIPATAAPPASPALPALPASQPTTAPAGADDLLDHRLPLVSFNGTRLEEAVAYFRDTVGLNIVVNWTRLNDVGATRDSILQMRVRDVPIRKCLDAVCGQLPGPDPFNRVVWVFDQGVVTITTTLDLPVNLVNKVYDVTDIVAVHRELGETDAAQYLGELAELIQSTLEVATWERAGGRGTIKPWTKNLCLIVTQTSEVHSQIELLLNKLRERGALAIHVQMRAIDLSVEHLPAVMADTLKQGKPLVWYPNDELVAELVERAKAHMDISEMYAPRMTILNGGTGLASAWTNVNYVSNFKATTQPSGVLRYEPEISTTKRGLDVTVTPFVSHDRKYVRLQIKHEAKRLLGIDIETIKPIPDAKENFSVQHPVVDEASFESDLSIENGKTACVGERAVEQPVMVGPGDRKISTRIFLLLVTPTIIDMTESSKTRPATARVGP